MVAIKCLYSGRVQGVGFRYRCHVLSQDYEVTGFVRNLDDGRVELQTEGDEKSVEAFLHAIEQKMATEIETVEKTPTDGLGRAQFRIEY